jgi:hypothetical protein
LQIILRPTTPADIDAFIARPIPYRARAYTAWLGDKILGIGGIAVLPDGTALAFLELADGANRYAVTLHKAALKTIEDAKARGIRRIVAQPDTSQPTAKRWLARLGFEPITIDNEEIYLWQRSPP